MALSVSKYIIENLQYIFKIVLKVQASGLAPIIFLNSLWERLFKARFLDMYCVKHYLDCYNFCQQCEFHFAIDRAKNLNQTRFVDFFLRNQINFFWQQHKRKLEVGNLAFFLFVKV